MKQSILGFLFCLFCSVGFCQQSTVTPNEKNSKYTKNVVRENDMSNGFSVKQRSNDTRSVHTTNTDIERKFKAHSSTNNSLRMQSSTSPVNEEVNKDRKSEDKDVNGVSPKDSKLSEPKR